MNLNRLEEAVLREITKKASDELGSEAAAALASQVNAVSVLRRENTGAGFNSTLRVESAESLRSRLALRAISNVYAKVDGLKNGMVFVLFFRDGLVSTLEGAAIDDHTNNVDFSNVGFDVSLEGRVRIQSAERKAESSSSPQ